MISTISTSIIIGDPIIHVSEQFNTDNGWYVGSVDDDASSGIWERGIPQET